MSVDIWIALIAAFASVLVGVLSSEKLIELFQKHITKSMREDSAIKHMESLYMNRIKVFGIFRTLIRNTRANRVLIFRCENGGGVPHAGAPIKISIVYEDHDSDLPSIRKRWQNRSIDHFHQSLIHDVVSDGHVNLPVDSIDANAELRALCDSQSIERIMLFRLGVSKGTAILYLQLDFSGRYAISQSEKTVIDDCMAKLREIFSEHEMMETPTVSWELD